MSCDTDQVDAVSISRAVGEIVTQMRTRGADAFSVLQYTHIIPVDLLIPKAGPPVLLAEQYRAKKQIINEIVFSSR